MNLLLTSEDWYLLMPNKAFSGKSPVGKAIYGDTLIVDAGTDMDGFIVSWGEKLTKKLS